MPGNFDVGVADMVGSGRGFSAESAGSAHIEFIAKISYDNRIISVIF